MSRIVELPNIAIDHHIQANILSKLADASSAVRFTDLKDDGVENSLFMYHANKLIKRGLIAKNPDGFRLTLLGARWVNSVSPDSFKLKPTVLPLVQFIITDSQGNVLLSRRKGQLRELINDYAIPGGLHRSGATAGETATNILSSWFPDQELSPKLLSIAEVIHSFAEDPIVHHSLTHIYSVTTESITLPEESPRFSFEIVPIQAINATNPQFAGNLFILEFFEKLQSAGLELTETFKVTYPQQPNKVL